MEISGEVAAATVSVADSHLLMLVPLLPCPTK
jgi:hypothetical protein